MESELGRKLDELNQLLDQNYITDTEYAVARENLLLDAGFDIVPRAEGARFPAQESSTELDKDAAESAERYAPERERHGGLGCLIVLLLLGVIAVMGGLLAIPEETLRELPFVGGLAENQGYQNLRRNMMGFIDDLRGVPAPTVKPPAPSADYSDSAPAGLL